MVQGLGFLSKKSWHTKNIANQEKVWIAEEREKDEKARTAELAKQIQQEREDDELSKIAGRKKLDRGIDWMYTGHHKESEMAKLDAAKESEEYLLGKKFAAPSGKVMGDLDAAADGHDGVNAVVAAMDHKGSTFESTYSSGALISTVAPNDGEPITEDSVAQRNEAFRIRHEDPMFTVSLHAVRKEKSIEKRKELFERAGIAVKAVKLDDSNAPDDDDRRKKSHKATKRRKDEESSYQSTSSKEEGNNRKRKRRKKHKHRKSKARSESDDSYSDESEYSRSNNYRRHQKSSHRDKGYHSSRKTHSSSDHHRDSSDRDGRYQTHDHREIPSRRGEPIHTKQSTDRARYGSEKGGDSGEYGLQGRQATGSHFSRKSDLGPDQLLLQRKNEDRDAERRRLREITSKRRHKSASEREDALSAMKRDAQALSTDRHQSRPNRDGEDERRHDDELSAAKFLHQVSKVAHDIGNNEESDFMPRHTQRNQGRNQRRYDDSFV